MAEHNDIFFDESSQGVDHGLDFFNIFEELNEPTINGYETNTQIWRLSEQGETNLSNQNKERFHNLEESNGYIQTRGEFLEVSNQTEGSDKKERSKKKSYSSKQDKKKQENSECQSKQKKETNARLKNFLPLVKKCLKKLAENSIENKSEIEFLKMFCKESKTSRQEFERIFNSDDSKEFLASVMLSRKLKRQMSLSRIDPDNRQLFRTKINLITKGFIERRLSNL